MPLTNTHDHWWLVALAARPVWTRVGGPFLGKEERHSDATTADVSSEGRYRAMTVPKIKMANPKADQRTFPIMPSSCLAMARLKRTSTKSTVWMRRGNRARVRMKPLTSSCTSDARPSSDDVALPLPCSMRLPLWSSSLLYLLAVRVYDELNGN